jgi:glycosyltransferase involved in cell wall biosynthesis
MPDQPTDAVIRFEPDGYDLNRPWLLGRQSAGNGFLRAAVQGRGEGPVYGYTPLKASAQMFERMVRDFDPAAEPIWIHGEQPERIGQTRGVLYIADPTLTTFARVRLRVGPASYSLCGVTHTLASANMQQVLTELLSEAVMPWDALICTSTVALKSVQRVLEAQEDFLKWRFGPQVRLQPPQLPIIPLGVHCRDFDIGEDERHAARAKLGIAPDEVAGLYVGRLVYTGKAHPLPMFLGLQAAAERTRQKLVLILCGRAPTDNIEAAYLAGAAKYAPDVRLVRVDSRDDDARRSAWAAGDIFISLADGIQETFGLTPLEAMARGMPVLVSDYNGYRDTVRDGVDGFRVATWAPEAGMAGQTYALRHELAAITYDRYSWVVAAATSVEMAELVDRLTLLVEQPDLRRTMGLAGQARARELFDWAHVFRQYQALWADLNARRAAAAANPEDLAWAQAAPRAAPSRLDPFHTFGHYPTTRIGHATQVALAEGVTLETYRERARDDLFPGVVVPEVVVLPMWSELENGPKTIKALARVAQLSPDLAVVVVGTLAKMGLMVLRAAVLGP